ncbi:hypothetical protein V6N13_007866 [Hibiscus sabdariffa]|uniref:Uncharacterized protein n=1 Tax=Hibiscus sabdariffa TaxID=183260 RepID=A0ABR2PBW5_9ROSI
MPKSRLNVHDPGEVIHRRSRSRAVDAVSKIAKVVILDGGKEVIDGFNSVECMRQVGCRRWRLKVGRLESLGDWGIGRWKRA